MTDVREVVIDRIAEMMIKPSDPQKGLWEMKFGLCSMLLDRHSALTAAKTLLNQEPPDALVELALDLLVVPVHAGRDSSWNRWQCEDLFDRSSVYRGQNKARARCMLHSMLYNCGLTSQRIPTLPVDNFSRLDTLFTMTVDHVRDICGNASFLNPVFVMINCEEGCRIESTSVILPDSVTQSGVRYPKEYDHILRVIGLSPRNDWFANRNCLDALLNDDVTQFARRRGISRKAADLILWKGRQDSPRCEPKTHVQVGVQIACSECDQPADLGRKLFAFESDEANRKPILVCGDCRAKGVPLVKQPIKDRVPHEGQHAWATPSWEDDSP